MQSKQKRKTKNAKRKQRYARIAGPTLFVPIISAHLEQVLCSSSASRAHSMRSVWLETGSDQLEHSILERVVHVEESLQLKETGKMRANEAMKYLYYDMITSMVELE